MLNTEKKQLWAILLIVFIGFIGTSIAYPIFPPLFLHPTHHSIIPFTWNDKMRSIFLGLALAAYPLGQFIGSPILGGCSDRYGRKKILVLSLIGTIVGYLLLVLSLQLNWLSILLLSRFLTGFMEGNLAIVRAMATDLENISKYQSLGRIGGIAAIGYAIGPLLGGFLSDHTIVSWFSYSLPFFIATIFSIIALFLAIILLKEKKIIFYQPISIWEQFNLISRFKYLFSINDTLKYLIIISTIFTFSVDIFYEFGPVYLTGLWSITPAGIAIYTGILSFTLAIGASALPFFLSKFFSIKNIIIFAMLVTAIILGFIAYLPHKLFAFILFGLIGLSIAIVNTNITIQLYYSSPKEIQGETMGGQLGLRMLGDAVICLIGGFLIISSVILPIAISCIFAFAAAIMYMNKLYNENKINYLKTESSDIA
jgi:DHA1 family tetracycline resistance protein-like MFS transporter